MKSEIDYGKIIAIGLIALLTTAILSTSALNTFSENDDEEEHDEERDDNDNNDSDDNNDNDNDKEQEEHEEETDTETATDEKEIKVEGEIIGNSTQVTVEIEFTSNSTSKESILKEILTNIRLDNETISNILEVETEEDDDEQMKEKEELKVKVEIDDGKAKVEFRHKFMVNATETSEIVASIVEELQKVKLNDGDIELKVESEGKHQEKEEFKAKPTEKIAEKVREAVEKKGKHEFVENIDNAEKYFGKLDKAVVALKIGLESDDIESASFGSAQLILVKIGDNEPMFRAIVNILTDQPIDTLTACLDGNSIGQLTIIHASEELGLSIGHLKETLTGSSITVPGVTVDIVNGTDCKGTPMLSGTV